MSNQVPKFEVHRQELAASLNAVAESMRSCAKLADAFATVVADVQYSPEEPKGKGKRKAALLPEDGEAPKKRKRITKPKDPNAPKKPASAYLLFQNEVRNELKNQHPNLTNSEILLLISDQWKKMTPEQKGTYFRIVEKAKVQYSQAKQAYESNLAETQATDAAAEAETTLQKEGAMPRGPKSATATGIAPGTSGATAKPASRPSPSKASEVSPSSDLSEDEESEEEPRVVTERPRQDSDSSDEESDDLEPSPKKRRAGSVQPKSQKTKKGSKK